jgi:predicted nucleic acid-binding protein
LLSKLFKQIIIPQEVYQEIVIIGAGQPGSNEVKKFDWIKVQHAKNRALLEALKIELDAGEAEAISLSIELKADLLLIDEKLGRTIASRFDIKYVGIIGLIIEAKSKGLIENIKPILYDLKTKAGFWISPKLFSKIIEITKEKQ